MKLKIKGYLGHLDHLDHVLRTFLVSVPVKEVGLECHREMERTKMEKAVFVVVWPSGMNSAKKVRISEKKKAKIPVWVREMVVGTGAAVGKCFDLVEHPALFPSLPQVAMV
jgi:hypothetical protein